MKLDRHDLEVARVALEHAVDKGARTGVAEGYGGWWDTPYAVVSFTRDQWVQFIAEYTRNVVGEREPGSGG